MAGDRRIGGIKWIRKRLYRENKHRGKHQEYEAIQIVKEGREKNEIKQKVLKNKRIQGELNEIFLQFFLNAWKYVS